MKIHTSLSCALRLTVVLALVAPFTSGSHLALRLVAAGSERAPEAGVAFAYNSRVAQRMAQVTQSLVYSATAQLTGNTPVVVAGHTTTLAERYTTAAKSLVTAYLYEYAQSFGLAVSYDRYTGMAPGCPSVVTNVVASMTGVVTPTEVVLITAHFDSYGPASQAADDNASGSAGVMLAARALSGGAYARSVRLIWFDGEEEGLCGSDKYARRMKQANENIVAVFNMDMISYDSDSDGVMELHTRQTATAGYAKDIAIASVFTNVIAVYGLSGLVLPVIRADGATWSDHSSFWDQGYAAICAIEDDTGDSNPYYHSPSDTFARLNMPYEMNIIKAAVATMAHLAIPATRAFIPAARRS
jgi:Zn-dependent M28 family amino/carboxypeptidase